MKDNKEGKENKISLNLRLNEKLHKELKMISNREMRSLNSQIEYFVLMGILEYKGFREVIEKGLLDENETYYDVLDWNEDEYNNYLMIKDHLERNGK